VKITAAWGGQMDEGLPSLMKVMEEENDVICVGQNYKVNYCQLR
jgi:hypothetical protein